MLRGPLLGLGTRNLDTVFGPFEIGEFRNLETHRSCMALSVGDLRGDRPVLARVHSSCVTSEFFGACDCDCACQLDSALEAIAAEGRGVLFYLEQEGRGAGLAAKARDRMLVQASRQRLTTFEAYERMGLRPELRRYDEVAAMAVLLGIDAPLVLLTNNPDKVAALEREKLQIASTRAIERRASPFNAHYLGAKRRSGHALADPSATLDAELPSPVEVIEPAALPGRPELVSIASYWLPVLADRSERNAERLPDPLWLRLHLYVDVELGGELVVLMHDSARAHGALVRIHPEPLLERFPLRAAPARESWVGVVRELSEFGAGAIAFSHRDRNGATRASEREGGLFELLAHHLRGRQVVPLQARGEQEIGPRLQALGLSVGATRELESPL